MDEKSTTSEERHYFCTNIRLRLYYLVMSGIFALTLFIEVVALGAFGVQFSNTRNFWANYVNGDSKVCVLYGSISDTANPMLAYNASCGFALWGLISIIIVLLTWIIYYIVLVIMGRQKITSLARILDLGMTCAMAILSLIVSSVLTVGFYKTCGSFNGGKYILPCDRQHFIGVNHKKLSFFGNLEAAKGASWVVMVIFTLLTCWNIFLLLLHFCCKPSSEESAKLISGKGIEPELPKSAEEEKKVVPEEKKRLTE